MYVKLNGVEQRQGNTEWAKKCNQKKKKCIV